VDKAVVDNLVRILNLQCVTKDFDGPMLGRRLGGWKYPQPRSTLSHVSNDALT
jgi:hypothetical protein